MGLTNHTITELGDDYDAAYRLVLATEDARVDVKLSVEDRQALAASLSEVTAGEGGGVVDTDADDPFELE